MARLLTVAKMQTWPGLESVSSGLLTTLEAGVVAALEEHTGRLYTSPADAVTEYIDGPLSPRPTLIERDIPSQAPFVALKEAAASLTSVDFRDDVTEDWEAQDVADFELDGRLLFLVNGENFPEAQRGIKVVYTWGYAEDAAPADAQLIVLKAVQMIYSEADRDDLSSEKIGPLGRAWATDGRSVIERLAATDGGLFASLRRPLLRSAA